MLSSDGRNMIGNFFVVYLYPTLQGLLQHALYDCRCEDAHSHDLI